ncbi:MAG TPA: hypothetical protein VE997_02165, partial [Candidatus Limnocylindria bacterium]|nr:hypothetical protein [Candidatus Limnocylindria bacterium]
MRSLPGVRSARASPATGNVLVQFDPRATEEGELVAAVARIASAPRPRPPRQRERPQAAAARPTPARRVGRRVRIALRGLDRDPELARLAVEQLENLASVARASANPLTARVLVELVDEAEDLDAVLATIAELERPARFEEELPAHPLDPGPVIEGAARLAGAVLGLGLLILRRATGREGAPVAAAGPGEAAALISLSEGLPPVSERLERVLGYERKELVLGGLWILSHTGAGSALGLTLGGLQALRLVTEARARRRAWQRYEERVDGDARIHPGAHVHLAAGDRVPLPATIEHGVGTAAAEDAAPMPVRPGERVGAGARLRGGPFELRLESNGRFRSQPPVMPGRPSIEETYVDLAVIASVVVAAAAGLLTRSAPSALTALLLMSPRPALIGAGHADLAASARVMRCGVV